MAGAHHTPATTAPHETPQADADEVVSPVGRLVWGDEADDDGGDDDSEEGRRYAEGLRRADGFASAEDEEEEEDGDDDYYGERPEREHGDGTYY